ncbi:hypothetical protein BDN72DRAFT_878088 [Pluteus cervinus]|uniref:Uncharacterized protein n=1 Tax=Pluteus cervinus TaxID=181527 RepID=A0ACD3AXE9_9AGAR|nr:hypothetical protein BDN72DRAFT_878088 [Pluteus cervinus]
MAQDILPFGHEVAQVVDIALEQLQLAGVKPIEWLALVYHRMGVPVLVTNFSYLVDDHDLNRASEILSGLGLPLSPPSRLLLRTRGDLHSKGRFYRVTRSEHPAAIQHLAIFPLSFSSLCLSDMEEKPPCHIAPSRCPRVLVPCRAVVYASVLRMMRKYPRTDPVRGILMSDLSQLIRHDLYRLECGYVDPSDDEKWERLEIDHRIKEAAEEVNSWVWGENGEWIRKALVEVVASGDVENLPCSCQ